MVTNITLSCTSCMGELKINHEMDPKRYLVESCPFCSSEHVDVEIEDEDDYDWKFVED